MFIIVKGNGYSQTNHTLGFLKKETIFFMVTVTGAEILSMGGFIV